MRERLIGPMADLVGIQSWRLRRLADRGLVPYRKLGRLLVFDLDDLATIAASAEKAGFLTRQQVESESVA